MMVKNIDLTTTIAGVEFESCLMNAAGVNCMNASELAEVVNSEATTFVTKSATVNPRKGNPEPRYFDFGDSSINSMGLPNFGIDYYLEILATETDEIAKTRFLSVSPLKGEDVQILFTKIKTTKFRGLVEVNLSCPNVPGKPQTAYDFERTDEILQEIFTIYDGPVGVKLPPYFDHVHFDIVADILNRYPLSFINSINSIGNGIVIDGNSTTIAPKNGFGGLGGIIAKPTALANVHAFYQRLKPEIKIIGTGGVQTGRDIYEHILCGASLIQIGTTLHQEGTVVFERLLQELKKEMVKNDISSLIELKGQLKYMNEAE